MRLIDLTGQTFSRLTVLRRAPNKSETDTNARWHCQCECGNRCIAYGQDLRREKFKSCGCLNLELQTTHGLSRSPEYSIWKAMKQRCLNPNDPSFHNYGGRGITCSDEWLDFESFLKDMGPRPSSRHTLERKDNGLGYGKGNCIWATYTAQLNNRRNNLVVQWRGKRWTLGEISKETGVKHHVLKNRIILNGWSVDRAISTPVRKWRSQKQLK